ncbi:MAG: carboxypeptidase regulatory-like domain-containing protein [Actinomycetes bacterium]
MKISASERRVAVEPGRPASFSVSVTNTGDVISGHLIRVLGADPSWVRLDRERLSLFPGTSDTVVVTVTLPESAPAGPSRVAVQVRELTPPHDTALVEVDLVVPPRPAIDLRIDPLTVIAGRAGSYGLRVQNTGNTTMTGALQGGDEEGKVRFAFQPTSLTLAPGQHEAVEMRVRARRRLTGMPVVRPLVARFHEDGVELADDERPRTTATFMQKPLLSRGALSLAGLLAAVSIFALVITAAFSGVVGRSAADRDLALQVAQAKDASATTGTSSVAGTVLLLTSGTPVAGVTVELFSTKDAANALTATATDAKGAYSFGKLEAGSYLLRFRGAGFAELWYPGALSNSDATIVAVQPGQSKSGLDVRLGGLPGVIAGAVVGDDVAGALVTLAAPLSSLSAGGAGATAPVSPTSTANSGTAAVTGAVVTSVTVGADGKFALAKVPSPSVYDLVVSKQGYATETQRVDIAGGETRDDLQIRLRKGDGVISGHVNAADGPIGGATVTATYGSTTVRTVSLTQDDVGGFTLRGLPTPGNFTVVVSKDGLAAQTLSLTLAPAQQLTGVEVTLGKASGSLAGHVTTLADGAAAAGVTVTVTNGDVTVATVTQSTGDVGAWSVSGLPIPSTYTVTFSRADLATQTVSMSLNAYGAAISDASADATSHVDAALRSATAVLLGTALQQAVDLQGTPTGQTSPLGEVSISLTSGSTQYQLRSASWPSDHVGAYEFDRLPPGTYTVSVSTTGTKPTSTILTLNAGDVRTYDPVLAPAASIKGTATQNGAPLAGAEVRLYVASKYPDVPLLVVRTGTDGGYAFPTLEAPEHYVVELDYPAGSPLLSQTVTLKASETRTVNLAARTTSPSTAPSAVPSTAPSTTATQSQPSLPTSSGAS